MAKKKVIKKPDAKNGNLPAAKKPEAAAPPAPATTFPIVGVGASAGGLAAFKDFLSGMPGNADPGMAFVLVQHLAPDHKSIMCELIRHQTRMQVFEVEDGMQVEMNCCYTIPPNKDMALMNGRLVLMKPSAPHGHRLPIDFFFRSLAQDLHDRAIGIILSGTGSDGSLGIRAIKGEGGMIMVQAPDSAEYDGMPRSAIATGMADFELAPAEMPDRLMAYVGGIIGKHSKPLSDQPSNAESLLSKIHVLLRSQTGHDFSQYKPNTIHRRVERRMALHQIETMADYIHFLQKNAGEIEALFRDLLIGVTNFFRDPDLFNDLEKLAIPSLFTDKPAGAQIRVWVPGCSTGEEAYSIAILLQEHMETLKQGYRLQVFATDIDSQAIATARVGLYPASIAADISPDRLARFFVAESDNSFYRINKTIRDILIYSEQDLVKDPPFSKLDLISCRNLLIYMSAELQKKLFPLFHYALKPNGFLFLGSSETVGEFHDLFDTLDRKSKLYRRKDERQGAQRPALGGFLPSMAAMDPLPPNLSAREDSPGIPPLRELLEKTILLRLAQAGALVNSQGDILYLHGRTGQYLEPTPGEAGAFNILKMAREGLQQDLSIALHKVVKDQNPIRCKGMRVKTNGDFATVNLTVLPISLEDGARADMPLFLVVFENMACYDHQTPHAAADDGSDTKPAAGDVQKPGAMVAELKRQLRHKEEYLQSTVEELETSNEELKSSNEEMQSMNEELQSTNEELETSKEELQSVNEELATVNAELQTKVADLSQSNNDMNNLLAGTGIGTVFVDTRLCILRYTPAATRIINLIQTDVGRPLSHLVTNLERYDLLSKDAQEVLDNLVPKEREVRSEDGKCYRMVIQPYRTVENVIEGAVITFVDITELAQARDNLKAANEHLRLAVVVRDSNDAVVMLDFDGRILAWNPAAQRTYGWNEAEALSMNIADMIPEEIRKDELQRIRKVLEGAVKKPHVTQRRAKDGRIFNMQLTATGLVNEAGHLYAVATTERLVE